MVDTTDESIASSGSSTVSVLYFTGLVYLNLCTRTYSIVLIYNILRLDDGFCVAGICITVFLTKIIKSWLVYRSV